MSHSSSNSHSTFKDFTLLFKLSLTLLFKISLYVSSFHTPIQTHSHSSSKSYFTFQIFYSNSCSHFSSKFYFTLKFSHSYSNSRSHSSSKSYPTFLFHVFKILLYFSFFTTLLFKLSLTLIGKTFLLSCHT